jgi:cytochrome c oxidase assembly protein subunit 15
VRLLRGLALATVGGAWAVIVIGGYVSQTGSGLGCSELILCGDPNGPLAAAIETTHRLAAWVEGLLVLAMLVLVMMRYRAWTPVRNLTWLAFVLVSAQAALGILAVATMLHPLVVTAHLGIATAFLAVTVLNAAVVFRGAPPAPAGSTAHVIDGAPDRV